MNCGLIIFCIPLFLKRFLVTLFAKSISYYYFLSAHYIKCVCVVWGWGKGGWSYLVAPV